MGKKKSSGEGDEKSRSKESSSDEKRSKESKSERKARYRAELERLQVDLAHLQRWVRSTGERVVVVFEGRDAAGKGGIIKRLVDRVSPRVFRVVALPAPSDREKTQLYMQRYIRHMPAAGEIVIFDRSWYNRPGVEHVMGFCTEEEVERFFREAPYFERYLVEDGIRVVKYFLTVSQKEQQKRFERRMKDPRRQWKLSPMDIASYRRWWEYTVAYDEMLRKTDLPWAPWWIVPSDDKRAARINCISHLLSQIPFDRLPFDAPELGERDERPKGCPEREEDGHQIVPERF